MIKSRIESNKCKDLEINRKTRKLQIVKQIKMILKLKLFLSLNQNNSQIILNRLKLKNLFIRNKVLFNQKLREQVLLNKIQTIKMIFQDNLKNKIFNIQVNKMNMIRHQAINSKTNKSKTQMKTNKSKTQMKTNKSSPIANYFMKNALSKNNKLRNFKKI